jgi:hypothetical protein
MRIFKSISIGFSKSFKSSKMIFTIYFFTLFLALIFVLPFKSLLSSAIGNSTTVYELVKNFDYTLYSDFLAQHKDIGNLFFKIILWFGIFYLLFTIFFSGGILSIIHRENNEFSLSSFFQGCGKYFGRFFKLFLIVLVFQLLFAVIIYSGIGLVIEKYNNTVESEVTFVIIAGIGITIHLLIFGLILVITDYAKILIVRNDSRKVLRSFWNSIKFVFSKFFSTYFIFLNLNLISLFIIIIYFYIESIIGMVSPAKIIVMFIIQQIYIWFRIFSKVWILASEYSFHSDFFAPDIKEEEPILIAKNEEWNLEDLNEQETV